MVDPPFPMWPALHGKHAFASAFALHFPGGHDEQPLSPFCWPGAHGGYVGANEGAGVGALVGEGDSLEITASTSVYFCFAIAYIFGSTPFADFISCLYLLASFRSFWALKRVHSAVPGEWANLPLGQIVQAVDPGGENLPARHGPAQKGSVEPVVP